MSFMMHLEELFIPGKYINGLIILPFSYTFKYIPNKSAWYPIYPMVIKLKFPYNNPMDFNK